MLSMPQSSMKISKETLKRLKEFGKMGDTFEDVVNRLLDNSEDEDLEDEEDDDKV